jgi:peptide/nickel transport system permease protein
MVLRYFTRKLGFYVLAAWAAITLDFLLPRLIPGNPVELLMARMAQSGSPPPGEAKALGALLGLSGGNIFQEYWHFLVQISHLNFGLSVTDFPVPVSTIIAQTLPWTVVLVGTATIISVVLGTTLGAIAGWKRGTWVDSIIPATTFLTAIPYFWLALLLLYFFASVFQIFPLTGGYSPTLSIGFTWSFIQSAIEHSVLPALTIVLASIGGWLLGMRNMTVTTLSEDYVVAAEARGLSRRRVMIGYAARNAVMPSVTGFGISLGFVVSGSIAMEYVFSYPGIGFELLQAVNNDDYALAQAIFLVITLSVLGANLIVDLLYGFVDPRTRQSR